MDTYVRILDLLAFFWATFKNLVVNTIDEDIPAAITFIEKLPINLLFFRQVLTLSASFIPWFLFFYICYSCCKPSTKKRAVRSESILQLLKSLQVDLQSARNDFEGLHPASHWVHFKCHMVRSKEL